MEDLFEELKHHSLERVSFTARRYVVTLTGNERIETSSPELLTTILKAIREGVAHV